MSRRSPTESHQMGSGRPPTTSAAAASPDVSPGRPEAAARPELPPPPPSTTATTSEDPGRRGGPRHDRARGGPETGLPDVVPMTPPLPAPHRQSQRNGQQQQQGSRDGHHQPTRQREHQRQQHGDQQPQLTETPQQHFHRPCVSQRSPSPQTCERRPAQYDCPPRHPGHPGQLAYRRHHPSRIPLQHLRLPPAHAARLSQPSQSRSIPPAPQYPPPMPPPQASSRCATASDVRYRAYHTTNVRAAPSSSGQRTQTLPLNLAAPRGPPTQARSTSPRCSECSTSQRPKSEGSVSQDPVPECTLPERPSPQRTVSQSSASQSSLQQRSASGRSIPLRPTQQHPPQLPTPRYSAISPSPSQPSIAIPSTEQPSTSIRPDGECPLQQAAYEAAQTWLPSLTRRSTEPPPRARDVDSLIRDKREMEQNLRELMSLAPPGVFPSPQEFKTFYDARPESAPVAPTRSELEMLMSSRMRALHRASERETVKITRRGPARDEASAVGAVPEKIEAQASVRIPAQTLGQAQAPPKISAPAVASQRAQTLPEIPPQRQAESFENGGLQDSTLADKQTTAEAPAPAPSRFRFSLDAPTPTNATKAASAQAVMSTKTSQPSQLPLKPALSHRPPPPPPKTTLPSTDDEPRTPPLSMPPPGGAQSTPENDPRHLPPGFVDTPRPTWPPPRGRDFKDRRQWTAEKSWDSATGGTSQDAQTPGSGQAEEREGDGDARRSKARSESEARSKERWGNGKMKSETVKLNVKSRVQEARAQQIVKQKGQEGENLIVQEIVAKASEEVKSLTADQAVTKSGEKAVRAETETTTGTKIRYENRKKLDQGSVLKEKSNTKSTTDAAKQSPIFNDKMCLDDNNQLSMGTLKARASPVMSRHARELKDKASEISATRNPLCEENQHPHRPHGPFNRTMAVYCLSVNDAERPERTRRGLAVDERQPSSAPTVNRRWVEIVRMASTHAHESSASRRSEEPDPSSSPTRARSQHAELRNRPFIARSSSRNRASSAVVNRRSSSADRAAASGGYNRSGRARMADERTATQSLMTAHTITVTGVPLNSTRDFIEVTRQSDAGGTGRSVISAASAGAAATEADEHVFVRVPEISTAREAAELAVFRVPNNAAYSISPRVVPVSTQYIATAATATAHNTTTPTGTSVAASSLSTTSGTAKLAADGTPSNPSSTFTRTSFTTSSTNTSSTNSLTASVMTAGARTRHTAVDTALDAAAADPLLSSELPPACATATALELASGVIHALESASSADFIERFYLYHFLNVYRHERRGGQDGNAGDGGGRDEEGPLDLSRGNALRQTAEQSDEEQQKRKSDSSACKPASTARQPSGERQRDQRQNSEADLQSEPERRDERREPGPRSRPDTREEVAAAGSAGRTHGRRETIVKGQRLTQMVSGRHAQQQRVLVVNGEHTQSTHDSSNGWRESDGHTTSTVVLRAARTETHLNGNHSQQPEVGDQQRIEGKRTEGEDVQGGAKAGHLYKNGPTTQPSASEGTRVQTGEATAQQCNGTPQAAAMSLKPMQRFTNGGMGEASSASDKPRPSLLHIPSEISSLRQPNTCQDQNQREPHQGEQTGVPSSHNDHSNPPASPVSVPSTVRLPSCNVPIVHKHYFTASDAANDGTDATEARNGARSVSRGGTESGAEARSETPVTPYSDSSFSAWLSEDSLEERCAEARARIRAADEELSVQLQLLNAMSVKSHEEGDGGGGDRDDSKIAEQCVEARLRSEHYGHVRGVADAGCNTTGRLGEEHPHQREDRAREGRPAPDDIESALQQPEDIAVAATSGHHATRNAVTASDDTTTVAESRSPDESARGRGVFVDQGRRADASIAGDTPSGSCPASQKPTAVERSVTYEADDKRGDASADAEQVSAALPNRGPISTKERRLNRDSSIDSSRTSPNPRVSDRPSSPDAHVALCSLPSTHTIPPRRAHPGRQFSFSALFLNTMPGVRPPLAGPHRPRHVDLPPPAEDPYQERRARLFWSAVQGTPGRALPAHLPGGSTADMRAEVLRYHLSSAGGGAERAGEDEDTTGPLLRTQTGRQLYGGWQIRGSPAPGSEESEQVVADLKSTETSESASESRSARPCHSLRPTQQPPPPPPAQQRQPPTETPPPPVPTRSTFRRAFRDQLHRLVWPGVRGPEPAPLDLRCAESRRRAQKEAAEAQRPPGAKTQRRVSRGPPPPPVRRPRSSPNPPVREEDKPMDLSSRRRPWGQVTR